MDVLEAKFDIARPEAPWAPRPNPLRIWSSTTTCSECVSAANCPSYHVRGSTSDKESLISLVYACQSLLSMHEKAMIHNGLRDCSDGTKTWVLGTTNQVSGSGLKWDRQSECGMKRQ